MKNEDKIIEILEGQSVDEDKIVEILDQLREGSKSDVFESVVSNNAELQIENEKDPLKKAALIAKRISESFDE